jgi:methionyl-tRNA formyltransferase
MKTLFFGTPPLAVPYLELVRQRTELQAVVTTPDEPAGRGYALQAPAVKEAALKTGLAVLQPLKLRDEAFLTQVRAYSPELVVVVAYGKILPPALLQIPRLGFLNVHFSLLPAYRGAAPIQRALMAGEKGSGVTLFWLDEGMDTGPIFLQKSLPVAEEDNAESLRQKLIPLGLEALEEALKRLPHGDVIRIPQVGAGSKAPPLTKEEGKIDWSQAAARIANLIRGTNPWPGAYTYYRQGGKVLRLKILEARVTVGFPGVVSVETGGVAGLESGQGFVVKCDEDFLRVLQVQPEGKKPMSAWAFWQGARLKVGEKLE